MYGFYGEIEKMLSLIPSLGKAYLQKRAKRQVFSGKPMGFYSKTARLAMQNNAVFERKSCRFMPF